MTFGEKIVLLRKKKGWSQEDLANELEISRQSVYKWESESTLPEIDKIKKLSKIFDVSIDYLLDDSLYEENKPINNKIEPIPVKKTQYRKVFNSHKELDFNQPEMDHGYAPNRKRRIDNSDAIYSQRGNKMLKILEHFGFKSTCMLQDDLAATFFQDENNCLFGFYYGGAIQFICPYENFISIGTTNSGNKMSYRSQSVFGVGLGPGGINSVGIGSIPQPVLDGPSSYDFTISYFDENGKVNEFRMYFHCSRIYTLYEEKDPEFTLFYNGVLSQTTSKHISAIYEKLNAIRVVGAKIHSGEIVVKELNINAIEEYYKKATINETNYINKIKKELEEENKKRKKTIWIAVLVILAAILIIIVASVSAKAVKKKKADQADQIIASEVVDMINQIDEVTLEDKTLLNQIDNKYSQLTSNQKSHVTNYHDYLLAQQQYKKLYKDYMEDYTKNDPTRNITLSDLKGTWENSQYRIIIDDLRGGESVWYRTYNKSSGTYSLYTGGSTTLPSSTLGDYDCMTQTKTGTLYHYASAFSEREDYSIKINSNGKLEMTLTESKRVFIKND